MRLIDADALMEWLNGWIEYYNLSPAYVRALIDRQPTIETDMSEYSDRLGKLEYERGKFEALDIISSAYSWKKCYFEQENGLMYSKLSGKRMSVNEAVEEFAKILAGDV